MMYMYCLGFAFNSDHTEVVLIIKNKPEWQKGKYNGLGGKIEKGETAVQAMVREFKEECDVTTDVEQWQSLCTMRSKINSDHPDKDDWIVEVFAAELTNGQWYSVNWSTDEVVRTVSVPLAPGVDFSAIGNLKWLIPMAINLLENGIPYIVYNYTIKDNLKTD